MRSKKLLILYAFLLIVAVVTMVQLWRLNQRPQEIGPRDYPEIKEEGILRMITEYNQSGYFVSGDTVQGFQYELSQAIAKLSGLEVQTHLEMSLAKRNDELTKNKKHKIRRNRKKHTHHLRDAGKLPVHRTDRSQQASLGTTYGRGEQRTSPYP